VSWPKTLLGDVVDVLDSKRKPITKSDRKSGPYPYYGATGVVDWVDGYLFDEPLVLIGEDGAKWGAGDQSAFSIEGKTWVNNHAHVLRPHRRDLLDDWLIYFLNAADLSEYVSGMTVPKLNQGNLRQIEVPLPSLDEQKRIVSALDHVFVALDRARANAEANAADLSQLRESIISSSLEVGLNPDSKRIRLAELCAIARGGSPRPISAFLTDDPHGINWIKISDATASGKFIESTKEKIIPEGISRSRYVISGSFLLTNSMSFGRPYILRTNGCIHDGWLVMEPDYKQVDQEYLYYLLGSRQIYGEFDRLAAGSTVRNLNIDLVSKVLIRLPSLEKQREAVSSIVGAVGAVDELMKANEVKIADIVALRQSMLQAAFAGQLT